MLYKNLLDVIIRFIGFFSFVNDVRPEYLFDSVPVIPLLFIISEQ